MSGSQKTAIEYENEILTIRARKDNLAMAQSEDNEAEGNESVPKEKDRVNLMDVRVCDTDYYSEEKSKFEGYHTLLDVTDDSDDSEEGETPLLGSGIKRASHEDSLDENCDLAEAGDLDLFAAQKRSTIGSRGDYYGARERQALSPSKIDFFANEGATPDINSRRFADAMREEALRAKEANFNKQLEEKAEDGTLKAVEQNDSSNGVSMVRTAPKRRRTWDITTKDSASKIVKKPRIGSATPGAESAATPGHLNPWDDTPDKTDPFQDTNDDGAVSSQLGNSAKNSSEGTIYYDDNSSEINPPELTSNPHGIRIGSPAHKIRLGTFGARRRLVFSPIDLEEDFINVEGWDREN